MKKTKPDYYRNGDIDVIDVVKIFDLNFNLGNVLKYIVRKGKKDVDRTIEDLEKAKEYIQREIDHHKQSKKKKPLTKKEYDIVIEQTRKIINHSNYLRRGQSFALALNMLHPELYEKYKGTKLDPFYDDNLLPAFKKELYED